MEQQRTLHSGCQVTGIRTPPVRRNSKLASLGRIFKPWKWRKKKNEKLRQSSTVLERKATARHDELVKKGLAEASKGLAYGGDSEEADAPVQEDSDGDEREDEPRAPLASTAEDLGSDEDSPSTVQDAAGKAETAAEHSREEEEDEETLLSDPSGKDSVDPTEAIKNPEELKAGLKAELKAGLKAELKSGLKAGLIAELKVEMKAGLKAEPALRETHTPPPKLPAKLLPRLGSLDSSHPSHTRPAPATLPRNFTLPKDTLRGRMSTPTGSPHLGIVHPPLPPSCIIEELHRALATKHRQDSFHGKEVRSSPKRRLDGRLSRNSSTEAEPQGGEAEQRKDAGENKENVRLDEFYSDPDSWNESVISGTLPRRIRKELLAVKLRNRPSKQELEERNIFPARSDQERQEIRQQIELKLAKRLSQRPAVEELESRNILKQRNDQTEQEEKREIKQRLNRKLNQRPTVDELRDRKILIRFSDYVEVAKAQDYDRRADKPWTRLSAADKAAIRKELNEFKSSEMEVHASSKHLTRFHRP
ncbi:phosphatase and actin regulator 3b isoform X2 [Brachyhypopomus gauderio]